MGFGSFVNKIKKTAGDVVGVGTLGVLGNNPMDTLAKSKAASSGTSETIQKLKIAGLTNEEIARLGLIDETVETGLGQTGTGIADNLQTQGELNSLFRDVLINFSVGQGDASPEQIADATSFVDNTFTMAAQQSLNQQIQDFQGGQDTRAAALGRQPTDIGFQAELFKTTADAQNQISLERGSRIAQRADDVAFNRPQTMMNNLGQASNFFNNNAANLLSNQSNLLNMASGQQDRSQKERIAGAEQISNTKTTGNGSKTASPMQFGAGVADAVTSILGGGR